MCRSFAFAILPLLLVSSCAEPLDKELSAVVRIAANQGGTPVRGTGFVISVTPKQAIIVTAAHVVNKVQTPTVTFAADLEKNFPAGPLIGILANSPGGLAAFSVSGEIPAGVTTLSVEGENPSRLGQPLFLLGFPQMDIAPRTTQRILSARREKLLLIDQEVGEGFSGGPVIENGKVVGVVTDVDGLTTYAVDGVETQKILQAWKLIPEIKNSPSALSPAEQYYIMQQMQPRQYGGSPWHP